MTARLAMRPTALGIKAIVFYAVLMAAFFAAPYTNLFFLLLAFLSVLGALTVVWTRSNLVGVSAEVEELALAEAGRAANAVVRLCGGNRPRFVLGVAADVGGERVQLADVAELRGEMVVVGQLPPRARGVYAVVHAAVHSTFPFGLLRARRTIAAPPRLVVYPKPADLGGARRRGEMLAKLLGEHTPSDSGDPEPSGLRDFRSGDQPRQVHWRASARRGRMVVREWDRDGHAALEVSLDLRAQGDALEAALSTVCALALWAREHKEPLLLHSQDHNATYGDGHRPYAELLAYLAAVQAQPMQAPPPPGKPGGLRLPSHPGATP